MFDHPRFRFGYVEIAEEVVSRSQAEFILACLRKHAEGDWGQVSESTAENNRSSLRSGGAPILSHYPLDDPQNGIWIRTDATRTRTRVTLSPEDAPVTAPVGSVAAPPAEPVPLPPPERSANLKPREPPAYYVIGRHIEAAGDLAAGCSYHVGTALVYCLRAGKKPGNSAAEDCRKAADHLLMEAERLEKVASHAGRRHIG